MGKRTTNRSVRDMKLRTVCDSSGRFRDMQAYKHPRHQEMKHRDKKGH